MEQKPKSDGIIPKDKRARRRAPRTQKAVKIGNSNPMRLDVLRLSKADMPLIAAFLTWDPIDPYDPKQVATRLMEYFQLCADNELKPGVVGMGTALGIDRRRLWDIKTGNEIKGGYYDHLPQQTKDLIKKAYAALEANWENHMQSGKINPPCGIFLGKNLFGYQDVVDYNITPKQDMTQLAPEQLQQQLNALPDD